MNTSENIALHCSTHYGEEIQAREIVNPAISTLVCEHEGQLVGYAQIRSALAPALTAAADAAEIQRLYVDQRWHGRGIAQALMAAALDLAERSGADRVWLGVWEHNPRAIAFYRKCGFQETGEQVFLLGTDPQRDLVMSRRVERASNTEPASRPRDS